MPFSTFLELLDRLERDGVPHQLNREYLSTFLGETSGAHAMATLRFLGMIDEQERPTGVLRNLVLGDRQQLLAVIVRERYAPLFGALQVEQANKEELELALQRQYHISGDTLRRARAFFVKAAQFTAIPLSHTITEHTRKRTTPPSQAGLPPLVSEAVPEPVPEAAPIPRSIPQLVPQRSEQTMTASPEEPSGTTTQTEDVKVLKLRSAGTVTLILAVPLFEVDKRDRAFIFDLVDLLMRYERGQPNGTDRETEGLPDMLPPRE
jgi:hypothetical protein